jgi:hypothetical protein
MQPQAAYVVTAKLSTAFPSGKLDAEAMKFWLSELEKLDDALAVIAAEQIINHDQWFPSWARFRSTYKDAARRQRDQQPIRPAIADSSLTPTDVALERIAAIKASIPKGPGRLTMPGGYRG